MKSGYGIVKDLSGSDFVYPGHPLVVATVIMKTYPDFQSANKPTGLGFGEAVGDNNVPGAGCHVGAAMRVLQLGSEGCSVDEIVRWAREYWEEGQAGGHTKYVGSGVAQARAIEPHFRELAAQWFAH